MNVKENLINFQVESFRYFMFAQNKKYCLRTERLWSLRNIIGSKATSVNKFNGGNERRRHCCMETSRKP